jgi:hypothetical protein
MSKSIYNIKHFSELSLHDLLCFLKKIKNSNRFGKKCNKIKNFGKKIITFPYV